MSWFQWKPYVPVAERRRKAQQKLEKLKKKGQPIAPVTIEGRTIAKSFWGKSWCDNLERYSDYANRLPRGRTYVRNGSVVDLQIAKGEVVAMVSGSRLYTTKIAIAPVAARHWKSICQDCAGGIDTLVELLQGRLAKGVMDRVCRKGDGLFPAPGEIKLSCSCPDWADMCKHVAAVLYGVGARLDQQPRLLFVLRGVDESELIARAGKSMSLAKGKPAAANVLDEGDVAAVFGLEMAETAPNASAEPTKPTGKSVSSGKNGRAERTAPAAVTVSAAGRAKTTVKIKVKSKSKLKPAPVAEPAAKSRAKSRPLAQPDADAAGQALLPTTPKRRRPVPAAVEDLPEKAA
jgi:uncharacterized Zn finger protein